MKKQKYDITPGEDKFLPVPDQTQRDYSLLRLHIDDLSAPIRRSNYARRKCCRKKDSVTASLFTALAIIVTIGLILYVNR